LKASLGGIDRAVELLPARRGSEVVVRRRNGLDNLLNRSRRNRRLNRLLSAHLAGEADNRNEEATNAKQKLRRWPVALACSAFSTSYAAFYSAFISSVQVTGGSTISELTSAHGAIVRGPCYD
jgi:hypothetical protein